MFFLICLLKCVKFDSNHTGDGRNPPSKYFRHCINSQVSSILHNRMWIPNFILVMVKFTAHENRSILIFTKFAACSWNTIILVFIDLFVCVRTHIFTKCTTLSATDFRIVLFCAVCFHHDDIACKTIIIIVMNYNNGLLKYFSFYSTATKIQEVFIVP